MKNNRSRKRVNVGLIGLGTVGGGVYKILRSRAGEIRSRTGVGLTLKKVCEKKVARTGIQVPRSMLTSRYAEVIQDPSIDIVIELIGGIHPAKEIIQAAFLNGKQVVTANKALLAEHGKFIFGLASKQSTQLGIEASVCGGIPIIKSLREGLASNRVSHFLGIVNGTCNFILTTMAQEGTDFETALRQAQAKGYAEKDPRLDTDGIDSAHKLAILARLAFRAELEFKSIFVEGIRSLKAVDVGYARELGYVIKLLAIGKKLKDGLELRVHPTMLSLDHPLANVRGVYNAVFVHGDQTGELLFYGRGAGRYPTASAVVSDVIDIAKKISSGAFATRMRRGAFVPARVLPIESIVSKYYLRFQVQDKPGVLGRIARILGRHDISILSVHQKESETAKSVPVIILTYEAQEKNLKRALREIDALQVVRERTVMIRVEK